MENATCENADKTAGVEVYLTDGKADMKVAGMKQSVDKTKFQVPRIKPGRYHLAFLTANKASMIEQPVVPWNKGERLFIVCGTEIVKFR